jgi:microcystin-dependent protein
MWAHERPGGGWFWCSGDSLPVSAFPQLYNLLGNRYGGDGNTFRLPDLRDRFPRAVGPTWALASTGGTSGGVTATGNVNGQIPINANNLPAHSHSATFAGSASTSSFTCDIPVKNGFGTQQPVAGGYLSRSTGGMGLANIFQGPDASGEQISVKGGSGSVSSTPQGTVTVGDTGRGDPLNINLPVQIQVPTPPPPFLTIRYAICVYGYVPG